MVFPLPQSIIKPDQGFSILRAQLQLRQPGDQGWSLLSLLLRRVCRTAERLRQERGGGTAEPHSSAMALSG